MGLPPPKASNVSTPIESEHARSALISGVDAGVVRHLEDALCARGYAVTPCGGPEDVWSAVLTRTPHLVVLGLPALGPGGVELCRRLRHESPEPRPLLLAILDDGGPLEITEALGVGVDDVMTIGADPGRSLARLDVLDARIEERLLTHRIRVDLGSTTQELGRRQRELSAVHRIAELSVTDASLPEVYQGILAEVARVMDVPCVVLERLDRTRERLVVASAHGLPPGADVPDPSSVHKSPAGTAVRTSKPVVAVDGDVRLLLDGSGWAALAPRAWAAFPLNGTEAALGTLTLVDWESRARDEGWIGLGEKLATKVAVFTERLESEAALRESEARHRALATELRQANQELEAFAYSVSHDLRAPLRTIQGFAHALVQNFPDRLPMDALDYARRIVASGGELERLLNDLLEYSRLSFEELTLKRVELSAVVELATEQVRSALEESRADLEVVSPLPEALGNQTALVQVVANLLSNAFRFVPQDRRPRVRVYGEEYEDRVRLWVEDNGVGIPAGQEERIFRVFERLEQPGQGDGTGIGLAIVRRGMQRIGGDCGVMRLPEQGSAFWIDVRRDRRAHERTGRRRPPA